MACIFYFLQKLREKIKYIRLKRKKHHSKSLKISMFVGYSETWLGGTTALCTPPMLGFTGVKKNKCFTLLRPGKGMFGIHLGVFLMLRALRNTLATFTHINAKNTPKDPQHLWGSFGMFPSLKGVLVTPTHLNTLSIKKITKRIPNNP